MRAKQKMNNITKYCVAILASVLALFLVGAQRINATMRAQHDARERTGQQVAGWHRQIASELPVDQQAVWQQDGQSMPIELLRACAIEIPINK